MPHTPGDWDFDEDEGVISAQGAPLATVNTSADFACLPDDQIEAYDLMAVANGRLMAASTKLLAACEAILNRLDYLRNLWGDEGVTRSLCDQVRAAVAAAKGGS